MYESNAPEGVIKFNTDFEVDERAKAALDQFQKENPEYNATSANCCDYTGCGAEAATNTSIDAKENLFPFVNATTPNKLFQEVSKLPGATVVKDPGDQVNKSYNDAYNGNGANNEENNTKKKE